MSWVKLDDHFYDDPKVLEAGNAAAGLYTRAITYCAAHRTNGFVPFSWAKTSGTTKERRALVDNGLWTEVAAGTTRIVPVLGQTGDVTEKVTVEIPARGYYIE